MIIHERKASCSPASGPGCALHSCLDGASARQKLRKEVASDQRTEHAIGTAEISVREAHLEARERRLLLREGTAAALQAESAAVVHVKRERLGNSLVAKARLQGALREHGEWLAQLHADAAAHGRELAALHAQMAEAAAGMEELMEELQCCVCLERRAVTALVPCGHCFCCAEGCASRVVDACPNCRVAVEGRTALYCRIFSSDPAPVNEFRYIVAAISGAAGRASRLLGGNSGDDRALDACPDCCDNCSTAASLPGL